METGGDAIREIVRSVLTEEQLARSLVYWDSRRRTKGERIGSGPAAFAMPYDGTIVFADLAPDRNWAHPCLYVCIATENSSTEVIPASFPPYQGDFPDTVVVVLRYGKKPRDEHDFTIFEPPTKGTPP